VLGRIHVADSQNSQLIAAAADHLTASMALDCEERNAVRNRPDTRSCSSSYGLH
jgi:hypothetical protein